MASELLRAYYAPDRLGEIYEYEIANASWLPHVDLISPG